MRLSEGGKSELKAISDDKSEKEMQFLWVQSVLKWQNEMGMQSSKRFSESSPRPVSITWASKKHEFLAPSQTPELWGGAWAICRLLSSAVSLAHSQLGEPLLEISTLGAGFSTHCPVSLGPGHRCEGPLAQGVTWAVLSLPYFLFIIFWVLWRGRRPESSALGNLGTSHLFNFYIEVHFISNVVLISAV